MWLVFRFSAQYNFDGDRHHRCWRCELPCACTCYLFTGFSGGNKQSFPQSSSFCMQRTLALRNSLKCKKYSALSCCCWLIFCAFYHISRKIFNQSIYFKLKSSFTTTWIISINVHWFKVFLTVYLTLTSCNF